MAINKRVRRGGYRGRRNDLGSVKSMMAELQQIAKQTKIADKKAKREKK